MKYNFDWTVLLNYRGLLLEGLLITLKITFISLVLALFLGTLIAIMRISKKRVLSVIATSYTEFFRNIPLVIQLFFWYFAVPSLFPSQIQDWIQKHGLEFLSAVTGLSIYTSAYIAEVIRSGIQSIPEGQTEAAKSQGLSYFLIMRYVIMPQAFRIIFPPLGSQFLNLTKNSSLAMTIGVSELTFQSQAIESLTFKGFEATTGATLIYLILSLIISAMVNMIGKYYSIPKG